MSFVIYNKETTVILYNGRTRTDRYKTEGSAKAALTRMSKWKELDPADFAIDESVHFSQVIEKSRVVKNLLSGRDVTIAVNTPASCDPSTETYWSM